MRANCVTVIQLWPRGQSECLASLQASAACLGYSRPISLRAPSMASSFRLLVRGKYHINRRSVQNEEIQRLIIRPPDQATGPEVGNWSVQADPRLLKPLSTCRCLIGNRVVGVAGRQRGAIHGLMNAENIRECAATQLQ